MNEDLLTLVMFPNAGLLLAGSFPLGLDDVLFIALLAGCCASVTGLQQCELCEQTADIYTMTTPAGPVRWQDKNINACHGHTATGKEEMHALVSKGTTTRPQPASWDSCSLGTRAALIALSTPLILP